MRKELNDYLITHLNDKVDQVEFTLAYWMEFSLNDMKKKRRTEIRSHNKYGSQYIMRACDARLNTVENPVLQYIEYMGDATPHKCEWGTAL